MAAIEFLLQVSAAAAGPSTLLVARLLYRWKRETDETIERNAEAIWGTHDPHAGWSGTVELVRSHEQRLRRLEAEFGFEPSDGRPLDSVADESVPDEGADGGPGAAPEVEDGSAAGSESDAGPEWSAGGDPDSHSE